jgi:hypothetical protein
VRLSKKPKWLITPIFPSLRINNLQGTENSDIPRAGKEFFLNSRFCRLPENASFRTQVINLRLKTTPISAVISEPNPTLTDFAFGSILGLNKSGFGMPPLSWTKCVRVPGRTPDPQGGEKGSCHEATKNVPYRVQAPGGGRVLKRNRHSSPVDAPPRDFFRAFVSLEGPIHQGTIRQSPLPRSSPGRAGPAA